MTQIFQAGELVAERFEIVRLVAEGGMGQVYEARDRTLGGQVALKLLNFPNLEDPAVNRRFRREVQLARQVTHPNVCRIYDVYPHRVSRGLRHDIEVTLVTMELLRGETLEEVLARRGPMSEAETLPLVRQMAAALEAAHKAGVIHRDFKPSNVILVRRDGAPGDEGDYRAVVTDFGLARSFVGGPAFKPDASSATPLTGEMKVVGTADYMAPEQIAGEDVGPAADVYAFGVVIFEMLTGRRPYSAPNALMLLARRATEPPSSPLEHKPDLDRRWAAVILRCLEREARDRPTSAQRVAELLDGGTERVGAAPARRGSLALAALATVLAAGVLVLLALRQTPRELTFGQAVQLTTPPGLEIDPTFFPDGGRIVYSSDESGAFELYVRELEAGGEVRRLTHDGAKNLEPAASPDGRLVAYHSADKGGIWEVPAAGGKPRRLAASGSRPAYSPDGRFLAFQTESAPQVSDNVPPAIESSTLWILDRQTGELRQLTRTGSPSGGHGAPVFSPDGRRIVFTASRRGASEIWSVDFAGDDPVLLIDDPSPAYDPVLSPDGRRLYFSGASRQVYALWVRPLGRGGRPAGPPRQVENLGLASLRMAAISPDGAWMAFTALFTRSNLWSLPLDPDGGPRGEPRPLTSGTRRNTRPSISPDGSAIAWESWARGSSVDIWWMAADGGDPKQLTVDPGADSLPSWSPDGGSIVFLRQGEEGYRLLAIDLENRREKTLATFPDDADWVRLAPGGARAAYHSRAGGVTLHVLLRDLAAGRTRQLTRGSELMGFPCWSPDGRWIVFQTRREGFTQMMLVASDGSGEPTMLSGEPAHHYPYSFSPDGGKIAFAADRGDVWNLWWTQPASGGERQLTRLELAESYVRYPAWSPRGDQMVYELAESAGDIWVAQRDLK